MRTILKSNFRQRLEEQFQRCLQAARNVALAAHIAERRRAPDRRTSGALTAAELVSRPLPSKTHVRDVSPDDYEFLNDAAGVRRFGRRLSAQKST